MKKNTESEFSPRASGGQNWSDYWLDIELLNEGKNFILPSSDEQFEDLLIQFSSSQCSQEELEEDVIRERREIGEGREMDKGSIDCEREQRWRRCSHSHQFPSQSLFLFVSRGKWPGNGSLAFKIGRAHV